MNVFKYLLNLYTSKDALFNHITLFSLSGLMTVAFSSYLSSVFGNIYGSFFDFISLSPVASDFMLVLAVMLLIFFTGYNYSVTNRMFYGTEELPELSLVSYFIFVKILPVILVWKIYEFAFFAAGIVFIPITSPVFYIYFSVLLCILPFLSLIYSMFVKDFKYRAEVFSPVTVFRVLNRSLGLIIFLWLQILVLAIIPCTVGYLLLKCSPLILNHVWQMGIKLGGVCILFYLSLVIKFAYNRGLVEIVQTKLSDI